jgi:hypothetical protein
MFIDMPTSFVSEVLKGVLSLKGIKGVPPLAGALAEQFAANAAALNFSAIAILLQAAD